MQIYHAKIEEQNVMSQNNILQKSCNNVLHNVRLLLCLKLRDVTCKNQSCKLIIFKSCNLILANHWKSVSLQMQISLKRLPITIFEECQLINFEARSNDSTEIKQLEYSINR